MEGLEIFTDEDLVTELKRRYPLGLVIAGLKQTDGVDDGHPDKQTFVCDFQCLTAAIGLCKRTEAVILQAALECTRLIEDEEEEEEDQDS